MILNPIRSLPAFAKDRFGLAKTAWSGLGVQNQRTILGGIAGAAWGGYSDDTSVLGGAMMGMGAGRYGYGAAKYGYLNRGSASPIRTGANRAAAYMRIAAKRDMNALMGLGRRSGMHIGHGLNTARNQFNALKNRYF